MNSVANHENFHCELNFKKIPRKIIIQYRESSLFIGISNVTELSPLPVAVKIWMLVIIKETYFLTDPNSPEHKVCLIIAIIKAL